MTRNAMLLSKKRLQNLYGLAELKGGYTATETEEPEDASGVFDSYPYEEGETT